MFVSFANSPLSISSSSSWLPLLLHLVPPKIVMVLEPTRFDFLFCFKFPGFFVICSYYTIFVFPLYISFITFVVVLFTPLFCSTFYKSYSLRILSKAFSKSNMKHYMCISLFVFINFLLICLIVNMSSCVLLFLLNRHWVFFNDVSILLLLLFFQLFSRYFPRNT